MSIPFDDKRVGATVPYCPSYDFLMTQENGEPLNPDIFTSYPAMLKILTDDITNIGIYTIILRARFINPIYE